MTKGICNVSIAPMRAESSDKSEIVSQLLYGESADILEVKDNWTKIKTHYDNYEAWMDTKQISPVSDEFLSSRKVNLVKEPFQSAMLENGRTLVSIGSEVSFDPISPTRGADLSEAEIGDALTFIEEAKPGDLAFFENSEGRIHHVGIILADQKIIHAHGKVRIDSLDSSGIFNKDQNKHTHKLRFIRSYF